MPGTPLEIVVVTKDVPTLVGGILRECPELIIHSGEDAAGLLGKASNARVLIGLAQTITPDLISAAPKIEWIQALTTGIDPLLKLKLPGNVVVTSARGVHGPQMSELAFMQMLALARGLPRMLKNQQNRQWERWPQKLLYGKTVVIVGVGAISEALAVRCQAFGMRVVGISDARLHGQGFDEIKPRAALIEAAGITDFLIVLAAATRETRQMINGAVLDALRKDAFFINVSRGSLVDEQALVKRLEARSIAGAALDVFETEPLPAESPLWQLDNVLITPHIGGMSDSYGDQLLPLVAHNLKLFAAGRIDEMRNRMNLSEMGSR